MRPLALDPKGALGAAKLGELVIDREEDRSKVFKF
jgi:hypothetical protein